MKYLSRFSTLIVLLAFFSGCKGSDLALYPAKGVLKWSNGKAAVELAQATIELRPVDVDSVRVSPRGEIKDDGAFVLRTYSPNDGVPAGEYKAVLMPVIRGSDETSRQRRLVDKRYESFATTPLTVTIEPRNNDLVVSIEALQR